jgi:membrane associated rhomboid family serine protease
MQGNPIIRRPLKYSYYNATLGLVILNIAFFLLWFLAPDFNQYLILFPSLILRQGTIWQLVTYMFVHSPQSMFHIIFNMLALFIFGITLEKKWGSTEFLLFYFITGIFTGLFLFLIYILGLGNYPTLGASGAIYGLLLAFATFFPDTVIYVMFIPMKSYIAVLIMAGLSIIFQIFDIFSGISHLGHLAGIGFGFLYCLIRFGINPVKVFLNQRR